MLLPREISSGLLLSMLGRSCLTILVAVGLSTVPVGADSGRGPLRSLNELPLETLFLAWPLMDPDTVQPGRWEWTAAVALTNVIEHEVVDDSTEVFIDAEPLRLDFAAPVEGESEERNPDQSMKG